MPEARISVHVLDASSARPDPAQALDFVTDEAFGGQSLFVGRVRRHTRGRACTGIAYDMFDALALVQFRAAAEAAIARHGPLMRIYVAHAKGALDVGDVAVVVAAGSPHRHEAFLACREVIEHVKHRSPIWKQEHYVDGSSEWSEGCSLCDADHADRPPATPVAGADAGHCDHPHGDPP
ncbi:molybdenum cofactor biosynthesis protein MoaE [Lysobacter pythonis]|uniref:Molybdopterin synthase catalytic subunit n=1 Tax=Solilutibacter pythonis TaxID=2483112 RepID=A0A3M2HVM8_9GAMM|nr:molybdenum cofactor biosynthesis protein MoaE [Lysobacter pythonis]RMH93786.1 molybdenum cofactor biosynthesis protein MoaE [Lysobacter pythonis]